MLMLSANGNLEEEKCELELSQIIDNIFRNGEEK